MDFRVVLVQWDETYVHAYRGSGSREFVMNQGDKISLTEASFHFPQLEMLLEARKLRYGEL
jgi:hypothetical protein